MGSSNTKEMDLNHDGKITRDEFRQVYEQLTNRLENLEHQKTETNKELETLKNINNELENENKRLVEKVNKSKEELKETEEETEISRTDIISYVDEMLTNEDANIRYLPDFVEKKIYENVFVLLLGLLQANINKTNVKLLGHNLKFKLTRN